MATPYSSPLHSPDRRRHVSQTRRNDPCLRASAVSPYINLPLWRIEDICDPEICDSCSCDMAGDTRFLTSMVTHQLPVPETSEENGDLLLASLVAHMVCKLMGDEERWVMQKPVDLLLIIFQIKAGIHGLCRELHLSWHSWASAQLPDLLPDPLSPVPGLGDWPRPGAPGDLPGESHHRLHWPPDRGRECRDRGKSKEAVTWWKPQ